MVRERNDRTLVFAKEFLPQNSELIFSNNVIITGEESVLCTKNGQIMIKTLVNLVSRFVDKIYIKLPDSMKELEAALASMATSVDTESFTVTPPNADVIISVGNTSLNSDFIVRINSNGWASYLTCNNELSISNNPIDNPIGAMGAACLGATEVFKRLLELEGCEKRWTHDHPSHLEYSFLNYSCSTDNADFPTTINFDERILLVGVGAVGSAFIYALSNINNIFANIDVIDPDNFDDSSLNRCQIAFKDKINHNKAQVAETYATNSLQIKSYPQNFEDFKTKNGINHPIIVSTVDKNDARYQIQSELPKLIFHGATGKQIAAVSIIKFLENACLCCIFNGHSSYDEVISKETGIPENEVKEALASNGIFSETHLDFMRKKMGEKAEKFLEHIGKPFRDVYTQEMCGAIQVETSAGVKSASVSFVSFFAGLALVAELIKYTTSSLHSYPMITSEDFLQFNLFIPSLLSPIRRVKEPKCILNCDDGDIHGIFIRKWNYTHD